MCNQFQIGQIINQFKIGQIRNQFKIGQIYNQIRNWPNPVRNHLLIGQLYEFSNELYMSLCHNRQKYIYKLFMILFVRILDLHLLETGSAKIPMC